MASHRLILILLLSALVLSAVGCSKRYRLDRDRVGEPSPWPFIRGEATATGSILGGQLPADLDVVWRAESNDKLAGPLTIYHGALIYPGTKKKIKFFDLTTGKGLGIIKAKGVPQTGLVMRDSMAYFALAPIEDKLVGYDVIHKDKRFDLPIKDAAHGPIIVENRLLVSSTRGQLVAYDLDAEKKQVPAWSYRIEKGQFVAPASFADGIVFQPDDRGRLHLLSPDTGGLIASIEVGGPIVSPVAIDGDVFVTDVDGHVYAVDPESRQIRWQADLGNPIWTSAAIAADRIFVGHSGGAIVALARNDGRELWRFEPNEVIQASPVVVGDLVAVATLRGNLFLLSAADGREIGRHEFEGGIAFPPVTDGSQLFVATQKGKIACLGRTNDERAARDNGGHAQQEPQ